MMKATEDWVDPVVEDVRSAREEILRESGGTLRDLAAKLMDRQKQHPEKYVILPEDPAVEALLVRLKARKTEP